MDRCKNRDQEIAPTDLEYRDCVVSCGSGLLTAIVGIIEDRDREIYKALLLDVSFLLQSVPSLQSIVPKLLNTPAQHFRLRRYCPIEVNFLSPPIGFMERLLKPWTRQSSSFIHLSHYSD